MKPTRAALIWSTFASAEDAQAAVSQLLSENLIACANIMPQVTSMYSWQGSIQTGDEVAALMKTGATQLEAATSRLAALHPYDVPAIAGWVADTTPDVTGAWLDETTGKGLE